MSKEKFLEYLNAQIEGADRAFLLCVENDRDSWAFEFSAQKIILEKIRGEVENGKFDE